MPPVQQHLFVDNYDVVILTCAILSLLFILVFVVFLARQSIARRRGIYRNALHRSTTSPGLSSPRALNVRKETLFPPTVSALVGQSILVASHPLRLGVVPTNLWPSSPARCFQGIPFHGLEPEPLSWGRANIRQFGLTTTSPASPPNGDGLRPSNTIWSLPTTLYGLRKCLFFGLFAGLRQHAPSPRAARKTGESPRHAPDLVDPTESTGERGLDVLEPDTVDVSEIFLSTDDAQVETDTLPIPLIILSLPSSENIAQDPSPPILLDEDFLSPNGTFRSAGRPARVADRTYDISNATRLALASRLRYGQKRETPFPSLGVLSGPGVVRWPRWL